MGGLLHFIQRGGDWAGPQPAQALLAVPNVTAHPSTASVPTSYYSVWHYNCLWSLIFQSFAKIWISPGLLCYGHCFCTMPCIIAYSSLIDCNGLIMLCFLQVCNWLLQESSCVAEFARLRGLCVSTACAIDSVQVGGAVSELVRQWPALHRLHPVV